MTHHKRRRPKHQRAGCLMCKPHKDERAPKTVRSKRATTTLAEHVTEAEESRLDALCLRVDTPAD